MALYFSAPPASPLLLASLGGSAVFLFGLTKMPAAQPRALFGGHLGGALIGIICYQYLGDAPWVYVLAEVATMFCLLLTRAVHPPAGANPLIMLHSHAAMPVLWQSVLPGVLSLAVIAWIWSRHMPGVVRYPQAWLAPSPATVLGGVLADDQQDTNIP